jgi:hypothetical protein
MAKDCDIGYFIKEGVLQLQPLGGYKSNLCHDSWLDYWVSCLLPENPEPLEWSADEWLKIWEATGSLVQSISNCNCDDACQGKNYGVAGLVSQCDCRTCVEIGGCGQDWECEHKLGEYSNMLDDPKLESVLQLTDGQRTILLDSLKELELGVTQQWGALQEASTAYLLKDDLDLVWLRRVAVSLFHELHCTFPWSIFQYSHDELVSLLLLHDARYNWKVGLVNDYIFGPNNLGRDYDHNSEWWVPEGEIYWPNQVWNANPLEADKIRAGLMQGSSFGSHADVLAAVLGYCCTKWFEPSCFGSSPAASTHVVPLGGGWDDSVILPESFNIDWVWANRFGGCIVLSYLLRHVFTAFNVPCVNGQFPGQSSWGHWGVYFPVTKQVIPRLDWVIKMCWYYDSECSDYVGEHRMPYHEYLFTLGELKELGLYSDPSLTYCKLRDIVFLRLFKYSQDPVLGLVNNCIFMAYMKALDSSLGDVGKLWYRLYYDSGTMYGSFVPAPLSDPNFAVPFWEWFMIHLQKYIKGELELPPA